MGDNWVRSGWNNAQQSGKNFNLLENKPDNRPPKTKGKFRNTQVEVGNELVSVSYDPKGQAFLTVEGQLQPIPKGADLPDYLAALRKSGKRYDAIENRSLVR